jgi:hypothetical protein
MVLRAVQVDLVVAVVAEAVVAAIRDLAVLVVSVVLDTVS